MQCRHRVATAGNGNKLSSGRKLSRCFRDLDRAGIEWLDLEGAERPVPPQRLGAREHRADMLDAAPADIEDHLLVAHAFNADLVRRRASFQLGCNNGIDRKDYLPV